MVVLYGRAGRLTAEYGGFRARAVATDDELKELRGRTLQWNPAGNRRMKAELELVRTEACPAVGVRTITANSARGYQSTSYLICMDIRYELGTFQNASKNPYRTIWASTLDLARSMVPACMFVRR